MLGEKRQPEDQLLDVMFAASSKKVFLYGCALRNKHAILTGDVTLKQLQGQARRRHSVIASRINVAKDSSRTFRFLVCSACFPDICDGLQLRGTGNPPFAC